MLRSPNDSAAVLHASCDAIAVHPWVSHVPDVFSAACVGAVGAMVGDSVGAVVAGIGHLQMHCSSSSQADPEVSVFQYSETPLLVRYS